jgi:hypothetical protein
MAYVFGQEFRMLIGSRSARMVALVAVALTGGYLQAYQGHLGHWLCALVGTQHFGSQTIHCEQCTVRVLNGRSYYSHALPASGPQ